MSKLIICFLSLFSLVAAAIDIIPPQVEASSYYLIDYTTDRVLAEHNADAIVEPASLTKMMTTHVIFKALKNGTIKLTDEVLISEKAWKTGGSKTFIEVGKQIPVSDLLRGVIIQSGNDASIALAEHLAGSEEAFAQLMNNEAKEIGMTNSHFVNSTGLPHPEHVSTARDMAKLAKALIVDFPEYYPIHQEKEFTYNNIKQENRNRLLWQDDSVDGIKTGYTENAGYCLVSSAIREDMRIITVVMGTKSSKERIQESRKLINFAFLHYKTHKLYSNNDTVKEIRIWYSDKKQIKLIPGNDVYVTIPKGQYDKLQAKLELAIPKGIVEAPLEKHQQMGKITVTLDDATIVTVPVVTAEAANESSLINTLFDKVSLMFQGFLNSEEVL